jgi:hypothetical protein
VRLIEVQLIFFGLHPVDVVFDAWKFEFPFFFALEANLNSGDEGRRMNSF